MPNQTTPKKTPISRKFLWILGLILLAWGIIGGLVLSKTARNYSDQISTKSAAQLISSSIQLYTKNIGKPPEGDSTQIFRTLMGSNPSNTVFLAAAKTNAAGEILDAWQTPFQIEKSGATNFSVRSAGKNKTFNDEDDIVSE